MIKLGRDCFSGVCVEWMDRLADCICLGHLASDARSLQGVFWTEVLSVCGSKLWNEVLSELCTMNRKSMFKTN